MIEIQCQEAPILAASIDRCFSNTDRVSGLIDVYRESKEKDILRMCVPLLHGAIEDCMRNLIYSFLTLNKNKNLLNEVPLIGINDSGRAEKFRLGDLLLSEESTVQELIETSVAGYVNRLTFNSSSDIAKWFRKFEIDMQEISPMLSEIELLFKRRHNIVHNGDFQSNRSILNSESVVLHEGSSGQALQDIHENTIQDWISVTSRFFMAAIPLFLPKGAKITMKNKAGATRSIGGV